MMPLTKWLLTTAVICLLAAPLRAQIYHPTGPLPSYDVASIKLIGEETGPVRRGQTVKSLIRSAFSSAQPTMLGGSSLNDLQVIGGPAWLNTDRYILNTKLSPEAEAALDAMPPDQQVNQNRMLDQSLLAERFHFKYHIETREMSIYELRPAKGGLKIKEVPPPPPRVPGAPFVRPKPGELRPGMVIINTKGGIFTMNAGTATMGTLVSQLQAQPETGDRLIVDKTGFTGHFDIVDLQLGRSPNVVGMPETTPDTSAASLFTQIEEKLGLKLVPTKGPVQVLIIDSIDRPTEN